MRMRYSLAVMLLAAVGTFADDVQAAAGKDGQVLPLWLNEIHLWILVIGIVCITFLPRTVRGKKLKSVLVQVPVLILSIYLVFAVFKITSDMDNDGFMDFGDFVISLGAMFGTVVGIFIVYEVVVRVVGRKMGIPREKIDDFLRTKFKMWRRPGSKRKISISVKLEDDTEQ